MHALSLCMHAFSIHLFQTRLACISYSSSILNRSLFRKYHPFGARRTLALYDDDNNR